jgi:RES domain-containing protein
MPLSSFIKPWSGQAIRHLPSPKNGHPIAPLDFRNCGKSAENRWNVIGEPTLYLAQDKNVALAEYARHFKDSRSPSLASKTYERKVYRFDIRLDYTIDLRNSLVCRALSLAEPPLCFFPKDKITCFKIARATAQFLRNTTLVQAMFVPSFAFLDDPDKWCLVIFLEKLTPEAKKYFKNVRADGSFRVT